MMRGISESAAQNLVNMLLTVSDKFDILIGQKIRKQWGSAALQSEIMEGIVHVYERDYG